MAERDLGRAMEAAEERVRRLLGDASESQTYGLERELREAVDELRRLREEAGEGGPGNLRLGVYDQEPAPPY